MKNIFPQETSYKKIFRKHGIPIVVASKIIGRSYGYTSHLMSGNIKMPKDAAEKGIKDGETVKIFSPRGSITAKAMYVNELGRGLLAMTHGWNNSNINELTDDGFLDPISGFPTYRGFLCNIEKV